MNLKGLSCVLAACAAFFACGGTDDDVSSDEASVLTVEAISFDLDGDRSLTTLTDEEIQDACNGMAEIFADADAGIACGVVASTSDNLERCEQARSECLEEPVEALGQVDLRASPGELDCSKFESELTQDCDFPVSLLEHCVNSIAQSVVPSAAAVSCDQASSFEELDEANRAATDAKDTSFVQTCLELRTCSGLIGALLGGGDTGPGGAGGAAN